MVKVPKNTAFQEWKEDSNMEATCGNKKNVGGGKVSVVFCFYVRLPTTIVPCCAWVGLETCLEMYSKLSGNILSLRDFHFRGEQHCFFSGLP